ncbi:hypothetical protein [Paenibacillus sp. J5C2022]|uniref:hypothetical protein n=1 Tax=Paenibacillus sp. J5C2022 TaxID=2977129 RepID=UPI0021CE9537|nr:hypothetical protein [Paenibacillus sp. J5C2022]
MILSQSVGIHRLGTSENVAGVLNRPPSERAASTERKLRAPGRHGPLNFSVHPQRSHLTEHQDHAVIHAMRYTDKKITADEAKPTTVLRGTLDRPAVRTGLTCIYAAGDWTGEEGLLLDACAASAEKASELVLSN